MNPRLDAPTSRRLSVFAALAAALLATPAARAEELYTPADQGQRPPGAGTKLLPEQFLRGFDPITAYFPDNTGPGRAAADDGAKLLRVAPQWPGAWVWADKKTLQFRPAEPWPPLARFAVEAGGARRVLTTMMSAPTAMSPEPGSDNLRPFRTVTLTFPQALPLAALKGMLKLEIRDLPGLADSPRHLVKEWNLAALPRANQRDPAVYALTLNEDVPEGKLLQVTVSLALGEDDKVLWTGRAATRMPFHLEAVQCGGAHFPVVKGGAQPRDMALACGNAGEMPQLVFSAPVRNLGLTELKKLVRLEPAVPDLRFETYGSRVSLRGKFVPDTLYRMQLGPASIEDDSGRPLASPGDVELFFYLGWKSAFLRWSQSTATVEANGPRMVPLVGYGDARADVRIYKIDPLHTGLWPFPSSPVVIDEESPPPFPGEEPATPHQATPEVDAAALAAHLRLLGSPLVSRIVDLPLQDKSGSTRFGLDLAPLLDGAVGKGQPGTYLVGVRRLSGPPQRAYLRVQVTNLSVTTVEERDRAIFFVRGLDGADPVRGATITLEGDRKEYRPGNQSWTAVPAQVTATTDAQGRAELLPLKDWAELRRLSVRSGDDLLVLDMREPPPRFAANHWSMSDGWLSWLTAPVPPPMNDKLLGFVFTERPIYKPGEPVFIKGYVRRKASGNLQGPGSATDYGLKVEGPDNQSWELPVRFTPLAGFDATFDQKDLATGRYTVTVYQRQPYQVLGNRTFQIEAYRVPTFEVRFTGPATVRLDGPFKMKALARYYAGGNVAGQPIRWTVTRRPWYHVPKGREGFLFASSSQFARPDSARGAETISRSGTLNDDGADEIQLNPALDIDGSARIYRFEATVTGPDNQEVSAAEEVKALPPFTIGLKVPRYLEKAKELKPEVLAVGVDDQPLAGQDVQVRVFRRVWHSHLRETNFATGKAQYVTEQEDVKLAEVTVKTQATPVSPTFPIKEAGVYVVELTARDKLGRVQSLSADLYIGGPQPVAWQKSRDGVFEVTPDQKTYKPGDTAKLVIQSPFQAARALIVVEEPEVNRYSWVDVTGGKAVIPVKIEAQHVPNLPVHVVLMRGRLEDREPARGGASRDDSRYRPATVASSIDLEVEPVRNQVLVKVAHPEMARPGTKVDFTITLTDDQKKPIGGEVTLWLVDEAVLSLAHEDPLDPLTKLIDRNRRISSIRDSRNTVIGRLFEQDEEPGGDGGENEEGAGRTRVVRKNFKTVPYYKATLDVPPSGKLTVPITLSDDLTNFKVRAVAASGMRRFGLFQDTLRVRLPVIVQPQLPRFVRQGDQFWAGGIARLVEGAEGPGAVDLTFAGPVDAKAQVQSVELKQNKPANVLVPVTVRGGVPGGTSELTVRVGVTRKSDGVGDAFEVKLPILPDRTPERVAFFDKSLKDGAFPNHPFPEPPRPGTVVQELALTNVPGLLEIAAGLEYLGQYPHGCLEQQMSQLYPEVAQGQILHRFGLDTGVSQANAAHVKKLMSDLPLFQDEQGLFAFWPGAKGEVSLTAQVVDFLQDVKKAGYPVDEKSLGRANDALKRALRSDSPALIADFRYNQQTEALRTLARAGQLDEHYLIELFQRRESMDLTSLATLAQAMQVQPQLFRKNLDVLKDELWRSVVFKLYKGQPVFEGLNWRRSAWGYGFLGSNTSTTAQVFQTLVLLDPSNEKLTLLRDAVLSYAEPVRGWGSTYDNRRAVAALATYLDKATEPTPAATVTLAGQGESKLDSKTRVVQKHLMVDTPVSGQVKGGPVAARVSYRYIPATPGDQVAQLKQGFLVSRGATLLRTGGGAAENFEDQAGATRKLAVGDILELHTRIVTDEPRYHVAIVVPFAAGLEPMNPDLANASSDARPSQADSITPAYVQRLDQEVRYYFIYLPKGTHSFHFRVKAATEGSFVHPAPRAELMYRDEVRGRGEGMRLVVTGSHEK